MPAMNRPPLVCVRVRLVVSHRRIAACHCCLARGALSGVFAERRARRGAMDRRALALLLAAVAMLALALGLGRRWAVRDAGSPDFPEGTLWVCGNRECGQEFTLSLADVAHFIETNPEGEISCPHCSQPGAERAQRCGVCSHAVSRSVVAATRVCPHCKSPFGRPPP